MSTIPETYAYGRDDLVALDQDDVDATKALLLGRTVTKFADDHLLLDNGTVIKVVPNVGGCSCGAGDYDLTELNGCDNAITNVEIVNEERPGNEFDYGRTYRIYVYAENQKINLVSVEGDDGNGYYGTGYELLVRKAVAR